MKKRKIASRRGQGTGVIARLLTIIAVMLIAAVVADMRIRPMAEEIIASQAKMAAFRTINAAMLSELEKGDVAYDDIVRLTWTESGTVTSIQTDIVAVNRLKSRMAETIAAQLSDAGNQSFFLPVGTLFGTNLTSGRGPDVEVRVIPAGSVQSELYNQFVSAGINQTLHQIMLKATVQTVAVLPGYAVKTKTSSSFCIAETVIVGGIPEGYTIVGEDGRSILSKVNDYKVE